MRNRKNKGFTLMDALLWFAVFGVMVAVLYTKFSTGMDEAKTKNEVDAMSNAAAGIKRVMQNANVTENNAALNATAINAGVVLRPWVIAANGIDITNSWGGNVTITNVSAQNYSIQTQAVPRRSCIGILTSGGDFASALVNAGNNVNRTDITSVAANQNCGNDANTITLTYIK